MNKIIFALIIFYIFGSVLYLKSLNTTIDTLTEKNEILMKVNQENAKTLENIKESYNKIIKINSELTTELIDSNNRISKLENNFSTTIKKIDTLAKQKPGLIENKINNASLNVIKCFEQLSRGEECD